jgi:hypothetical protein
MAVRQMQETLTPVVKRYLPSNYLLVRLLALRFNFLSGLAGWKPLAADPESEVRFAAFLAAHNERAKDANIQFFTQNARIRIRRRTADFHRSGAMD